MLAALSVMGSVVFMIWLMNTLPIHAALPTLSQKGIDTAEHHVYVGDANNPKSYCNTGTPETSDKVFPARDQRGSTTRCK